ncbi:toprim domain-containing protein [Lysobacter sp. K5869]|uniref:toprim domain-containing protein n=1 Tax=Lysobacter sp. K5869 TaxID=2820808 RepID=UPI001C0602E9|nr:toprim domain-containing protein [Lysobacter sp. K5869]QWP76069.1 toprim domain-containing protein [Lysobacter sp. K5869]
MRGTLAGHGPLLPEEMNEALVNDIVKRLRNDFGFKSRSGYLQEGKCPECGHKELFTSEAKPNTLKCGRANNCGAWVSVRQLYPDLFEAYSDRNPQTADKPHAAADAYLSESRGFDLSRLRGLYTQEWHRDAELKITTATVRFPLPGGSWWERFIDRAERFGKQKAKFAYGKDRAGEWWQMLDSAQWPAELWLVEGIFDAIALEHHGVAARALLSCNNYPDVALARLRAAYEAAGRPLPVLVWALDGDKAGRDYTAKWHARALADGWKSKAAQIPQSGSQKIDWNDLHLRNTLGPVDLETFLYHGALLVATTPSEKARLMHKRVGRATFYFEHGRRLYWSSFDVKAYDEAREKLKSDSDDMSDDEVRDAALTEALCVSEICNCYPQPLYYQANRLTGESWYYYRVTFPPGPYHGTEIKGTFKSNQLTSATEFRNRLLDLASGAFWDGTTAQVIRIAKATLYGLKTVETIPFIGYAREHGCYVFGDVAVKDGAVYKRNDEDYFDMNKLSIKSLSLSTTLTINRKREDYRSDWLNMIWACYGVKGMVATAFWFGSLFVEQIRAKQQSYPFLEMSGEPGTGKSTLIDFLWKLVGRVGHEGIDPSKSSLAGRIRTYTQVGNLPVVLIEADRGKEDDLKQKKFDWEEIKPMFNGHIGRAIGVKNTGTDTHDPPFRGALLIEQNAPVSASRAVLERIVHMTFDKSLHSRENKAIAEQLAAIDVSEVSAFVLMATQREAEVLRIVNDAAKDYANQLLGLGDMKNVRLAHNHAQMMALVDALKLVAPLTDEQHRATHAALIEMALARQVALDIDHAHVQTFWELYDFLGGDHDGTTLNHSRDPNLIAISLVEFEARVMRAGSRMPCDLSELKSILRTSRARKFVDHKTINSRINNGAKKCWVFQRES